MKKKLIVLMTVSMALSSVGVQAEENAGFFKRHRMDHNNPNYFNQLFNAAKIIRMPK